MLYKNIFSILLFLVILLSGFNSTLAKKGPNNTPEMAYNLTLDNSYSGTLNNVNVVNWWKVTIPSDGKLVVATLSDQTLEIDNYIYAQDKKTVIAKNAYGGYHNWDTVFFNNLAPGTYYVKTNRYSGYGSYSITSSFIPTKYWNDDEPNDISATATPFELNSKLTGHLGFSSSGNTDLTDWRKITIPSSGKLVVTTLSDQTLEIDNYIYAQDRKTIIAKNAYGGYHNWDSTFCNNLAAGTYYIKSICYDGYGSYSIVNSFIPIKNHNNAKPGESPEIALRFK